MNHLPFIVGSYAAGLVILVWCALAPVLRGRRLTRALQARENIPEEEHASQA